MVRTFLVYNIYHPLVSGSRIREFKLSNLPLRGGGKRYIIKSFAHSCQSALNRYKLYLDRLSSIGYAENIIFNGVRRSERASERERERERETERFDSCASFAI